MVRAFGTGVLGAGVTLASTFAPSLGLTLHQQRIGFAVGGLLMLLGLALLIGGHLRHRKRAKEAKPNGYSPEARRQKIDDLFYPPADPRRELAEDCASMAMKLRLLGEEYSKLRPTQIPQLMNEIQDAEPGLDPEEVHRRARSHFDRSFEADYKLRLRDQALSIFDAARQQEAIAVKPRRNVERPEIADLGDLAGMFRAMARRLGIDVPEPDPTPKPKPLTLRIDDLHREGQTLLLEVAAPVVPERQNGVVTLAAEEPEEEWEKVEDFEQRIRALFMVEYPALLQDYAKGANAFLQERQERREREPKPDPKADKRSDLEKWIAFVNSTRSGPALRLEASMEGLATARHRAALAVAPT